MSVYETVTESGDASNEKTLDDYVDLDAVIPTYRIQYRTAKSDQANGSMSFSEPKSFLMDATEEGDGYLAGIDDDGRDIYISANKRINVREADEDGAARFLGYFRGCEELDAELVTDGGVATETNDQTNLWTYSHEAADTCPSGREWCDGPDSEELCCFGCFGGGEQ